MTVSKSNLPESAKVDILLIRKVLPGQVLSHKNVRYSSVLGGYAELNLSLAMVKNSRSIVLASQDAAKVMLGGSERVVKKAYYGY